MASNEGISLEEARKIVIGSVVLMANDEGLDIPESIMGKIARVIDVMHDNSTPISSPTFFVEVVRTSEVFDNVAYYHIDKVLEA